MRWSVRFGVVAMGVASVALAACGSSDSGSDGADSPGGSETSSGCELVSLDAVKGEFPDYSIDKAETTEVEGSTDACEFTGKPAAGAMGEYTDATTVTLTVGTFDEDADGEAAFTELGDEPGAETASEDGYEVVAAEDKAVAKFDDGTYAFSSIASPEMDGPGTEQTMALIALLAAAQ